MRDGWRNLHHASSALMDERARTYDDSAPHPLTQEVDDVLTSLPWVRDSRSRVRDQGHVFHVEAFISPLGPTPTLEQLEQAVERLRDLDWKIHDVMLMPVRDLPDTIPDPTSGRQLLARELPPRRADDVGPRRLREVAGGVGLRAAYPVLRLLLRLPGCDIGGVPATTLAH